MIFEQYFMKFSEEDILNYFNVLKRVHHIVIKEE